MKLSGQKSSDRYESSGFGLVETIVGAAIMGLVLISLGEIGRFTLRVVDEASLKLRAAFLAEEGVEAVRAIRDTGWSANIAPLPLGQDYYLRFSGGIWILDPMSQPKVDNIFDRRVVFGEVKRNASDDIVSAGGVSDPDAKKVTVRVSWATRGGTASTTMATYLTNLFAN